MSSVYRGVATIGWLLALALSVILSLEFHSYEWRSVALGIAMLALGLSAFGLSFARDCWKSRQWVGVGLSVMLWLIGVIGFAIVELGFWSSSYKLRHSEYMQHKAAETRLEALKDQAWDAVRTGEVRSASAELAARLKVAEQSERWLSTKSCTDATIPESRAFCRDYFDLVAKQAQAKRREEQEARLLEDDTAEVRKDSVHHIFAFADMLADNANIEEQKAATIVILTFALVLMLARDVLLVIANPFGGAIGTRAAAKASEKAEEPAPAVEVLARSDLSTTRETPPLRLNREATALSSSSPSSQVALEHAAQGISESVSPVENPDPDGGGNQSKTQDDQGIIAEKDAEGNQSASDLRENVIPIRHRDTEASFPVQARTKKPSKKEGCVKAWLADCSTQTDDKSVKATVDECHRSYLAWCHLHGFKPLHKKVMSRQIRAAIGRPVAKGQRGPRNGKGAVFPHLQVYSPVVEKRKVAAA